MHRPSSFPGICTAVSTDFRPARVSLSLSPFLHSVDRARFSFGERENIEYNMGRGPRIIYTRRLGFFQKNSHKESDLIRFRRRIFIREACTRGDGGAKKRGRRGGWWWEKRTCTRVWRNKKKLASVRGRVLYALSYPPNRER